jgi:hypothetical protein
LSEKQTENRRKPPHSAWKPGQTGNPKGRPKLGNSIAECVRDYMTDRDKADKQTRTYRLVEHLYASATGDNPVPAARLILETLGMLNIEGMLEDIRKTLQRVESER